MRKKIIAANWKMNITSSEAESYVSTFLREIQDQNGVEIVLAPPFTAIAKVSEMLGKTGNVKIGAQNMHPEKSGAFTGEISAAMLRDLYVRYVILGHSERRALFGETDAFISKKAKVAVEGNLRPIVCVGETLEQRDAGQVEKVLDTQVRGSLAGLSSTEMDEVVIAYEPVWAIGTGRTASPAQAQEAHAFIRSVLKDMHGEEVAGNIRIQYGGSVKPENTQDLMRQPDIDGALVGGASLDPRSFAEIIELTASLYR
jgi:triosephosphate isomerase